MSRINQANTYFDKKDKLFTSNNISLELRKKLAQTYMWIVFLYRSEIWTYRVMERKSFATFWSWIYWRMLKISWIDRVSNDEVLKRMGEKPWLLKQIEKMRNTWIRPKNSVANILEASVKRRNCRSRPTAIVDEPGCQWYVEGLAGTDEKLFQMNVRIGNQRRRRESSYRFQKS